MDYQDKYDELDNIVNTLSLLIDEISDKNYIDQLNEIVFEANNELREVEDKLQEQRDREYAEQEKQYWEGVI